MFRVNWGLQPTPEVNGGRRAELQTGCQSVIGLTQKHRRFPIWTENHHQCKAASMREKSRLSCRRGWNGSSGLEMSLCLSWRSLSITLFWVMVEWSKMDRRIRALSTVIRLLFCSVAMTRELSWKAKLLIYCSVYIPALTWGHELWIITDRTRPWTQRTETGFLCRVGNQS